MKERKKERRWRWWTYDPVEEVVGIAEVAAGLDDGPAVVLDLGVVEDVLDLRQRIATHVPVGRVHPHGFRTVPRYLAAHHLDRLVGLAQVVVTVGTQKAVVVHRRYTYPAASIQFRIH